MPRKRDAFTLIEMMVVVLIIGILASIAIPQYVKTVEASKARSAIGTTHLIGIANRMYEVDRNYYASGVQTDACNDGAVCDPANDRCNLVRCNYLAAQNWGGSDFNFYICDPTTGAGGGNCAAGDVASCSRKGGGPGVSSDWGYRFDKAGACIEVGTNPPPCPSI